ncbi:MAG: type IV secretion system DNA-binding domain-containing protein [Candidatus Staskawiczbacteria bacterium]|nr:type IV secretion system DNA-binding domain-containing protein [Candidatus Staskawiczbacteria bacterium]
MSNDITFIAKTNFRNQAQKFGIKRGDRRQHMYVIGKTGVGKTAFLKNMALQDINNGQGLAVIDPHGEFVEEILDNIPPHRINDVVYFNPSDMEYPVSFNIMDVADPRYKHLIASGLIGIFTKIWANVWSARMEYILANCILALLDTPGTTLLGIPRMLVDRDYRQKIINNLKDPVVKSFWVNEYEEWDPRYRNEAIAPVQNKVGQFLNVSFVRNIVGQAKNTIDIDEIMNTQKILLVNVSKGRIGEDNSAILGAMIITKIQLAAMERVRIPEDERKDFYLYVDEFQNFATDSFVNILSEARKYRLDLIIAHQYIGQLVTDTSTAVRDAVFGNVGTMVSFRVGAADAEFLEQEFTPEFLQDDLVRLDNYNVYLKLMIDGITSRPFSATTIAPAPVVKDDKRREEIIKISRSKYAHSVGSVEGEISSWAANKEAADDHVHLGHSNKSSAPRSSDSTKLYDAVCSNCGKATKVIFPPTEGRAVYCKSCLKKMPRQGRGPAVAGKDGVSNMPVRAGQSEKRPAGASALEELGIEFGPARNAPSKDRPTHTERAKIEEISFSSRRQKGESRPASVQDSPRQRKEINLADLKKALEDSLSKSDLPDNKQKKAQNPAPAPDASQNEVGWANEVVEKVETPEEELKRRREQEKYEDKVVEDSKPKWPEKTTDNQAGKRPLDPGKKVKL